MANQKKLLAAAIKFRKENPRLHWVYSALLSGMANFIRKNGAAEVTVGYNKRRAYYEYANS